MSQTLYTLKLLSGAEIVGRLVSEDDDVIVLEKARVIQMVQTGPQQVGMSLQPFMVSDIDGEIPFLRAGLATRPITPSEEVETPYLEQTTSIALA